MFARRRRGLAASMSHEPAHCLEQDFARSVRICSLDCHHALKMHSIFASPPFNWHCSTHHRVQQKGLDARSVEICINVEEFSRNCDWNFNIRRVIRQRVIHENDWRAWTLETCLRFSPWRCCNGALCCFLSIFQCCWFSPFLHQCASISFTTNESLESCSLESELSLSLSEESSISMPSSSDILVTEWALTLVVPIRSNSQMENSLAKLMNVPFNKQHSSLLLK